MKVKSVCKIFTDRFSEEGDAIGSVRPSVCFHFYFRTEWPLTLSLFTCMVHDRSSPGIEGGHRSVSKVTTGSVRSRLRATLIAINLTKHCVPCTQYTQFYDWGYEENWTVVLMRPLLSTKVEDLDSTKVVVLRSVLEHFVITIDVNHEIGIATHIPSYKKQLLLMSTLLARL